MCRKNDGRKALRDVRRDGDNGGDFLFVAATESRPFRGQKLVDELLRSEFSNNQPSYRDSDNGFVNFCHPRRQRFSILQEGFDYHLSDFLYIAQSFFSSLAPGGGPFLFKFWDERAPHIFVRFQNDPKNIRFHILLLRRAKLLIITIADQ
jgi:hypothetical protein